MPRLNRLLFKSGSKGPAGFTLIEVLIALTIFAIGLLALAGMQVTGIRGNATSHAVMAKVALADGVLEEFLAMAVTDPRLMGVDLPAPLTVSVDGAGAMTVSVSVEVDPPTATPGVNYDLFSLITATVEPVPGQRGSTVQKSVMKRRM